MVVTLSLSGCSFSWLHQKSFVDTLGALADAGFRTFEMTTAPPHLFSPELTGPRRRELARAIRSAGLRAVSVNPTFVDVNLISTNPVIREAGIAQMAAEMELAAECEAPFVVIMPGHRHALAPAPDDFCAAAFDDALDRLLPRAESLGVTLSLENSPYGYMGSAAELLRIVTLRDSGNLGITYDVANVLAIEDPAEGVRAVGDHLRLAHISDTWRHRWAHTSPGRGEVDFAAFAAALSDIGFAGPTVYELVDGEPVEAHLADDLTVFSRAGWNHTAVPE